MKTAGGLNCSIYHLTSGGLTFHRMSSENSVIFCFSFFVFILSFIWFNVYLFLMNMFAASVKLKVSETTRYSLANKLYHFIRSTAYLHIFPFIHSILFSWYHYLLFQTEHKMFYEKYLIHAYVWHFKQQQLISLATFQ